MASNKHFICDDPAIFTELTPAASQVTALSVGHLGLGLAKTLEQLGLSLPVIAGLFSRWPPCMVCSPWSLKQSSWTSYEVAQGFQDHRHKGCQVQNLYSNIFAKFSWLKPNHSFLSNSREEMLQGCKHEGCDSLGAPNVTDYLGKLRQCPAGLVPTPSTCSAISLFLFFFLIFKFYFIYFLYSRFSLVINFIHISVYMSIPITQFSTSPSPHPLRFSRLGVHTFVLYICVSTSALQTSSPVSFF